MEIMDQPDNSKLEEIPCPVCRTKKYTVLQPSQYPSGLSNENLREVYLASSDRVLMDQLVQCRSCSLVYLNPRIGQEIILSGYKNAVDPTFTGQNAQRIKTFKRSLSYILSHYFQILCSMTFSQISLRGGDNLDLHMCFLPDQDL